MEAGRYHYLTREHLVLVPHFCWKLGCIHVSKRQRKELFLPSSHHSLHFSEKCQEVFSIQIKRALWSLWIFCVPPIKLMAVPGKVSLIERWSTNIQGHNCRKERDTGGISSAAQIPFTQPVSFLLSSEIRNEFSFLLSLGEGIKVTNNAHLCVVPLWSPSKHTGWVRALWILQSPWRVYVHYGEELSKVIIHGTQTTLVSASKKRGCTEQASASDSRSSLTHSVAFLFSWPWKMSVQIGLHPWTTCEDSDCSDSLQVSVAQLQGHPIKTSGYDQHPGWIWRGADSASGHRNSSSSSHCCRCNYDCSYLALALFQAHC